MSRRRMGPAPASPTIRGRVKRSLTIARRDCPGRTQSRKWGRTGSMKLGDSKYSFALGESLHEVVAFAERHGNGTLKTRAIQAARLALLEMPDACSDNLLIRTADVKGWDNIGATMRQACRPV